MNNIVELKAREGLGKINSRKLRKDSLIPGVIYGDKIKNRHFIISSNEIIALKKLARETGLLDVKVDKEEPVKAIIQNIQTDAVTSRFKHIDLYQVRMDKKLHTEVSLEFTGESKAVQDLAGILVKQYDKLPVECLPKDIIQKLDVPIDSLNTFEDVIRVQDLNLPEGVETHLNSREIVASVSEPRTEEELEELEGDVKSDVGDIEVTGEKPEEGEEGEETGDDAEKKDDAPAEDAKDESKEESKDKKKE